MLAQFDDFRNVLSLSMKFEALKNLLEIFSFFAYRHFLIPESF
jgi:hypothetical protein